MLKVRFECGQEDRMSEDMGPFDYVQITYDSVRTSPDGENFIAHFTDGWWITNDGQRWSDIIMFAETN